MFIFVLPYCIGVLQILTFHVEIESQKWKGQIKSSNYSC